MLLKTPIKEALDATKREDIDQRIVQMLLVLQVGSGSSSACCVCFFVGLCVNFPIFLYCRVSPNTPQERDFHN